MIPLDLGTIASLCPGTLERAPGADVVTGVVIDSRRVARGDLFVAVAGGEVFVRDAIDRGAAATLVPDDAFASLAALGHAVRDRASAIVVAITGSTGKTSTKDILAAICTPRSRTVAAEASFNNELGVPLTLCRLEHDTEICILELAMRGFGQIADLAAIAGPDVGVITNVGPAHLELVGSLEGVARAKGELIDGLSPNGIAIVPESFAVDRADVTVIRVGTPDATVADGRTTIRFQGREVRFPFESRHQAENAHIALHAARAVGLDVEGDVDVTFSRWRGEEIELPGGGRLVNDCWNANPVSMRAALEDLVDRAEGRRTVAVLGEMAELGDGSEAYHREVGALVAALGIDVLVAVGERARLYGTSAGGTPEVTFAADAIEAATAVARLLAPGDTVVVKGSRVAGLEVVADALAGVRN